MTLARPSACRRPLAWLAFAATALLLLATHAARAADPVNAVPRTLALEPASAASASTGGALIVGSKRFTESYILGEILRQTAATAGPAEHRQGLGNTAVVLAALKADAIDVYPEYLGTIDAEILGHRTPASREVIASELAEQGLGLGIGLGFSNGYALAMPDDEAARLHISKES